ncbi:MAG: histidinol dehydrogenase [Bacteroidota bacterium]
MEVIKYPLRENWKGILTRPAATKKEVGPIVEGILAEVKAKGDEALKAYTEKFDDVKLESLKVTEEEFKEADQTLSHSLKNAIDTASANVEAFHRSQWEPFRKVETMPGVLCWRKSVPIQKVGLYIPGGTAPLFSSLLMLAIPALVAGCEEIVVCSPPGKDGKLHPAILYIAGRLKISQVYKVGGAQAIAAMAYGTESIPQVYKIFGPGNTFVTKAKQLVSQDGLTIDMPAGPSEVAVMIDQTADPEFVAADLLAQAEHGTDSQVLLVAKDEMLVAEVLSAIRIQLERLPRKEIAEAALENSKAILLHNMGEMLDLVNEYAPEHLIMSVDQAESVSDKIINAGSVFLGHYSPESIGDYASGTNHTLPTFGYAKATSGVSLDSFVKKITFQQIDEDGIQRIGPVVEEMAEAEGLHAHKWAVSIRLDSLQSGLSLESE